MWPEIEDTIVSLGDFVLALSPLLEGTLDNISANDSGHGEHHG